MRFSFILPVVLLAGTGLATPAPGWVKKDRGEPTVEAESAPRKGPDYALGYEAQGGDIGGTPAEGAPTNFGVNHEDLKAYLKDAKKHPRPDHPGEEPTVEAESAPRKSPDYALGYKAQGGNIGGTPAEAAPTNFGVNHEDLKAYLKDAKKHPRPDHPR